MKTASFEQVLAENGQLIYTQVGTSMLPLLRQKRDLLIIRKRPEGRLKKLDIVLFKRGGHYVLHRIIKLYPDCYVIRGDNLFFAERDVQEGQIIGLLHAVVRNGVEYPMGCIKMRAYGWLRVNFPIHLIWLFVKYALNWVYKRLYKHE